MRFRPKGKKIGGTIKQSELDELDYSGDEKTLRKIWSVDGRLLKWIGCGWVPCGPAEDDGTVVQVVEG